MQSLPLSGWQVQLQASLGGLGTGLAVLFYFLNRQVIATEEGEDQPFDFSMQADGNSVGALIQENAFMVSIMAGVVLVVLLIALAIISGAIL